jgi:hypothetical protein
VTCSLTRTVTLATAVAATLACIVQDWLLRHGLERSVLAGIRHNFEAHAAHQAWLATGHGGAAAIEPASAPATAAAAAIGLTVNDASAADVAHVGGDVAAGEEAGDDSSTATDDAGLGARSADACKSGAQTDGAVEAASRECRPPPPVIASSSTLWRVRVSALHPLGAPLPALGADQSTAEFAARAHARAAATWARDAGKPETWVGQCLRVYWPEDAEWYSADVVAWLPAARKHRIVHHDDGERETLDLAAEDAAGHVQWLGGAPTESWPPPPPRLGVAGAAARAAAPSEGGEVPVSAPAAQARAASVGRPDSPAGVKAEPATVAALPRAASGGVAPGEAAAAAAAAAPAGAAAASSNGQAGPDANDTMGWRVEVFWPEDGTWYAGIVDAVDLASGRTRVHFDDNEREWHDLTRLQVRWLMPRAQAVTAAAREDVARRLTEQTAAAWQAFVEDAKAKAAAAPERVPVHCNGVHAHFIVRLHSVETEGHGTVSATEFERLAGKGSAKKWKVRALACSRAGGDGCGCRRSAMSALYALDASCEASEVTCMCIVPIAWTCEDGAPCRAPGRASLSMLLALVTSGAAGRRAAYEWPTASRWAA